MHSGALVHQETGEQRRLGEYQLKLLIILAENAGRILTREELTALVWHRRIIGNNSLPNAVHALRITLGDDGKQQRIIKTIPKQGYILESDFCHFPAQNEPVFLNSAESSAKDEQDRPERIVTQSEASRVRLEEESRSRFWRWMCLSQGALLLMILFFLSLQQSPQRSFIEQEQGTYSNIRLYALDKGSLAATKEIAALLNPALFALNALLATRHSTMQVWFDSSTITLNYTLVLTNTCQRRQLAMNIAQFRSDDKQLNALIYRETERELNEMAHCLN